MLDALQWLSVRQRTRYLTMVFIYKMINNLLPSYLSDRIIRGSDIHRYFTRNASEVRTPTFIRSATQKSLYYKGINDFNSLPREIKCAPTLTEFKKLCISHVKCISHVNGRF